jgi:hypothetical protein
MLEFNPEKRISAEEAIADSYFDDVRIKELEEFEICDINLQFDHLDLSPEEIKEWIVKEINSCATNILEMK